MAGRRRGGPPSTPSPRPAPPAPRPAPRAPRAPPAAAAALVILVACPEARRGPPAAEPAPSPGRRLGGPFSPQEGIHPRVALASGVAVGVGEQRGAKGVALPATATG
ncbi:hypothetical protein VULLAG_LOCUS6983 [Vulpes lagopus]